MNCKHNWQRQEREWCYPFWMCTECELALSESQYSALRQAVEEETAKLRAELLDVIRTYIVDDDDWDPDAKALEIMKRRLGEE